MRLTVRSYQSGAAFPAESPHRPARVWRDPEGRPSAYGYGDGEGWMIAVPGVAAFRFGAYGGVAAAGYPGAGRRRICEVYHRAILPLVLQYRGREVLHASAVFTPRGV